VDRASVGSALDVMHGSEGENEREAEKNGEGDFPCSRRSSME